MSHLSPRPEQSTDEEIAVLENLALLSPSPAGQFIRKTTLTTFENATPSGGGGGTVDSVVAGTGISVDNTDPANPIVSATGGGTASIARTFMLMGA